MTPPANEVNLELHEGVTYVAPICMPEVRLMMGNTMAVLIFETVEGAGLHVPFGHQALTEIRDLMDTALSQLGPQRGRPRAMTPADDPEPHQGGKRVFDIKTNSAKLGVTDELVAS